MTHRIRGSVKLIIARPGKIFGVIIGDDLRDHMFIPSYVRVPGVTVGTQSIDELNSLRDQYFRSLTPGTIVEFTPRSTERGMRAMNVSVLPFPERSHGESLQS